MVNSPLFLRQRVRKAVGIYIVPPIEEFTIRLKVATDLIDLKRPGRVKGALPTLIRIDPPVNIVLVDLKYPGYVFTHKSI